MEKLIEDMKVVLATMFAFYLKSHYFHWNVIGKDFVQLHQFFGNLYESVFDSIDDIAEHIRALGEFAPGSFKRFQELSQIQDELAIPNDEDMISKLLKDNQKVIDVLNVAFKSAMAQNKQGLANYLSERIDTHEKHGWMLSSIIRK